MQTELTLPSIRMNANTEETFTKTEKAIGDYVCNDSVELEKKFSQLQFNWE